MKGPILDPVRRTGFRSLIPLIVSLAGLICTVPAAAQEQEMDLEKTG